MQAAHQGHHSKVESNSNQTRDRDRSPRRRHRSRSRSRSRHRSRSRDRRHASHKSARPGSDHLPSSHRDSRYRDSDSYDINRVGGGYDRHGDRDARHSGHDDREDRHRDRGRDRQSDRDRGEHVDRNGDRDRDREHDRDRDRHGDRDIDRDRDRGNDRDRDRHGDRDGDRHVGRNGDRGTDGEGDRDRRRDRDRPSGSDRDRQRSGHPDLKTSAVPGRRDPDTAAVMGSPRRSGVVPGGSGDPSTASGAAGSKAAATPPGKQGHNSSSAAGSSDKTAGEPGAGTRSGAAGLGRAASGPVARSLLSFQDEVLEGEEAAGAAGETHKHAKHKAQVTRIDKPVPIMRAAPILITRGAPVQLPSELLSGSRQLPGSSLSSPNGRPAALPGSPGAAGVPYGVVRGRGASNVILADDDDGILGGALSSSGLSSSGDEEETARKPPASGRLGHVVFGVAQARCSRPYMEDRHCCVSSWRPFNAQGRPVDDGVDRSYVGVFDGHNGARTAEVAAARLHTVLASDPVFRSHTGELGPPAAMAAEEAAVSAAIKRAFKSLDDDILEEAAADGGRDGSTALVLLRLGDTLYVAHAGDSRAVLGKSAGTAMALTRDHKPDLPTERARVEAIGGRVEMQRCWRVVVEATETRPGSGLAVSRSLGDIDFKRPKRLVESIPDVSRYVPRPGDAFVVLASDGLWDVLSDQDAVEAVNSRLMGAKGVLSTTQVTSAAEAALNLAVRRGTLDNVTVVVMALTWGS